MPLPNLETLHKYTDAVLDLIQKANAIGASVELAVKALHDRFFQEHEPSEGFASAVGEGPYSQCPPEIQAAVDAAVARI